MQSALQIVAVGINHRTALLEVRERFAIPSAEIAPSLKKLVGSGIIREADILSTCNRVEIYTVSANAREAV